MIHPLSRWLFEHETNAFSFAREHGFSAGYLSSVMSYRKFPTLAFIAKIKEATGGELNASHFEAPLLSKAARESEDAT